MQQPSERTTGKSAFCRFSAYREQVALICRSFMALLRPGFQLGRTEQTSAAWLNAWPLSGVLADPLYDRNFGGERTVAPSEYVP